MHYETTMDLRRAVEAKRGALPDLTWNAIEPDWSGPYGDADLAEVVKSLPVTAGARSKPRDTKSTWQKAHEQAALESAQRYAVVEPFVQSIRRQLFAIESPPFGFPLEGWKWIAQQADTQALAGTQQAAEYGDPYTAAVFTAQDPPLAPLQPVCKWLMEAFACIPSEALDHILTGKALLVPPLSIAIGWTGLKAGEISVTVRTNYPWVSKQLVAEAYSQARCQMLACAGKLQRAQPSPVAFKAVAFLAERKGLPRDQVLCEWNRLYPQHKCTHWRYLTRMATR